MPSLITVGLPVYNSMPFVRETVEALLSQTITDFEILAVVQPCKDDSSSYLESIRDRRLRIVRQTTPGLAKALNRMLAESNTPWLVRQDTDDVPYPHRLETIIRYIRQHPNAAMFYSLADYHPKDRCVGQFRSTRGTPEEIKALVRAGYLLSICHPTVVLNREKLLSLGGYREDLDLWWRVAVRHEIRFIPEVLLGFRQNAGSLTSQSVVRQVVETLYVQYLLISHLHRWEPQPAEAVRHVLERLVSKRDLAAKENLRQFNMMLSEGRFPSALMSLVRCASGSPAFFAKRVSDELRRDVPLTNGIDPKHFIANKAALWPASD